MTKREKQLKTNEILDVIINAIIEEPYFDRDILRPKSFDKKI